MSIEIHVMNTPKGRRFRIWSDTKESYESSALDEQQLRDALFHRSLDQAITDCLQRRHHRQLEHLIPVSKWERFQCSTTSYSEEYWEQRYEELFGAKYEMSTKTAEDGVQTVTIVITPLPRPKT